MCRKSVFRCKLWREGTGALDRKTAWWFKGTEWTQYVGTHVRLGLESGQWVKKQRKSTKCYKRTASDVNSGRKDLRPRQKNNRLIVKRNWEVNSDDHRRLDHTWCQWTWGASDEWWSRTKEINEVWKVTCLNFHKKFGSYDGDEETELSLWTNNSSVAQRSWEGISRRRTEGDTSLVIHRTMQTSPIGWGRTGYWWNL